MDQAEFFTRLDCAGLHTQEALGRFMGNEALFLSFVTRLPEQLKIDELIQSLDAEDADTFYRTLHNLKGLAGNLSISPIYQCAQAILVEFRASQFQNKQKLSALTQEVAATSKALTALITEYLSEGHNS